MIAFSFFGIAVYWYGIFYFLTFLFGYLFLLFLRRYSFLRKYSPKVYDLLLQSPEDIVLYSILGVLVGGRLGHILIYDFSYYLDRPLEIFALWKGGMSFIGGIFGVIVSLFFFFRSRQFASKDFLLLADLLILPTSFGIMLGRIGNFLNQELYGRLVSDVFPTISSDLISFFSRFSLFYVYDRIDGFLRINTNFLSSFLEGGLLFLIVLFVMMRFLITKKRNIGVISSFFLIWYSFVRFFLEYLRADSQMEYLWIFTRSQWFFVLFFLLGCWLLNSSWKGRSYIK